MPSHCNANSMVEIDIETSTSLVVMDVIEGVSKEGLTSRPTIPCAGKGTGCIGSLSALVLKLRLGICAWYLNCIF